MHVQAVSLVLPNEVDTGKKGEKDNIPPRNINVHKKTREFTLTIVKGRLLTNTSTHDERQNKYQRKNSSGK